VLVSSPFYLSGRHPSPDTAFYYPIPAAGPFDCLCMVSPLGDLRRSLPPTPRARSFSFAIGFCSLSCLHSRLHYTVGPAFLLFSSILPSYPQPRFSATHPSLNPRVKDSRFYHGILILTAGPEVTGTRCVAVHLLSACSNHYVGLAYTLSTSLSPVS
jgi:hypothetical protein